MYCAVSETWEGNNMDEPWEVLESEVVLDHAFLGGTMQRLRLPDGRVIPDWPIVRTRDYANVVVTDDKGQFMILEGYKHGLGRSSWQVPGGYLEEGEEPLVAAMRELLEETGYTSDRWRHLGSFIKDANRRVGTGHYYLASNAVEVSAPENPDRENYITRWVTPGEVSAALGDGRVAIVSYAVSLSLALLATGYSEYLGGGSQPQALDP